MGDFFLKTKSLLLNDVRQSKQIASDCIRF